MTFADQPSVQNVLKRYETAIFESVRGGWEDWRSLQLGGRLLFPARSRACLVYDFIVQRASRTFANDPSIRIISRDETVKFVFEDRVLVRFKKANGNGLGSNIETQATLGFVDQQYELPGLPDVHKVEVVYVLNGLQTLVDQVSVTARDGDVCLWKYVVTPDRYVEMLPLPTVAEEPRQRPRVKLRLINEDRDKEVSEK